MIKNKFTFALLFIFIYSTVLKAQSISQLGVWNNNANFVIKYHQNKVITSTTSGIQFIDVSNPTNPMPSASIGNPGSFPMAIEVDNNYAYFGGGMTGYFMIADISNINFPVQVGITNNISGTAYQIAIKNNYAFMATNSDTLYAINITNKTAPLVIGKIDLNAFPEGIIVNGNYVYVGTSLGLKVVDITNPSSMNVINTFGSGYGKITGDLPNNRIFVAKGSGFDAINISNATNPTGLFQGIGGGSGGDLVYKNGFVFQKGTSVSAFQIGTSSATYLGSFSSTNGQVNAVTAKDSVFYLSTVNNLHVLKLGTLITSIKRYTVTQNQNCYPNPAKNMITVTDDRINPSSVIKIYNSKGQEIKKINADVLNTKEIDVAELNSGIYFIGIVSDGLEKRIKFIKD